jgi:hypothetical protein
MPLTGAAAVIPLAPIASASRAITAHALARITHGTVDTTHRISLPSGDFSWVVGRHDLASMPPIVVDLDVSPYCEAIELPNGTRGFPVSRRHATLARIAGRLTLTPAASGTTFTRKPGCADFEGVDAGTSRVLETGARVVFGTVHPLILEVI